MAQAEQVGSTTNWGTGTAVEICRTIIPEGVAQKINKWAAKQQTREAHIARVGIDHFVSTSYSSSKMESSFGRNAMALFYSSQVSYLEEGFHSLRESLRSDPDFADKVKPEDPKLREHITYWPGIPRLVIDETGAYRIAVLEEESDEEIDYELPAADGVDIVVSGAGKWAGASESVRARLEKASTITNLGPDLISSAALVRAVELRNAIKHGVTFGRSSAGLDWIISLEREVEPDKRYLIDNSRYEWPQKTDQD